MVAGPRNHERHCRNAVAFACLPKRQFLSVASDFPEARFWTVPGLPAMHPESLRSPAACCTVYNYAHRMALTSGTKLGPYEIQSPLGAGGMGEVYRAKDTQLDRTVAIKVLPSHLSSDPELKQRMEREAKAISALQHANICTLHDIGTQDGTDFL
jgi:serine/threonine protein kinase